MQKRFGKINIEISNICNLQCSFCPEVIRPKRLMPLELFEKIIDQVAPLTELVCFHLMGEPLVHPRLGELIEICERKAVKIFLVSNGILLREDKMPLLESPAFAQINFSLHSFHDNHGDRDPGEYLERIFTFTEKALRERPLLYLNFRLWNLHDTRGTGFHNQEMLRRIEDRFQVRVPRDIDLLRRKSVHLKGRLYLHFDSEFIWPSLDLPVLGTRGRCHALSNHFGILVDGTVVPCCLDKEGAIPLGNVQSEEILHILESERARKILEGFRARHLREELCQKCQYIERFRPVE